MIFALFSRISFKREQKLILEAIESAKEGMVLDLACGSGIYSRTLALRHSNGRIIGADLSLPMLEYADHRAELENIHNLNLVRCDAANPPFPYDAFDAVICCGALHLFAHPVVVLENIFRLLRSGGPVVLAVFRRKEGKIACWRDKIRQVLYGISSFTEHELYMLLHNAGFRDIKNLHAKGIWIITKAGKPAPTH